MNFVGTGKRLTQGDIGDAARMIGIKTAVLLAFIEVEAAGRGFDNRNRPKMLRETHIFYRELGNTPERNSAVQAGLATKSWVRNYKSESYSDLARMMAINKNAALRSCSWGLPQILGNNCLLAGFTSAEIMVRAMMQGEREQLIAMVTFLKNAGIVPFLQNRDFTKSDSWRDAARRYNGPAYEANNYHVKMATAYRKHVGANGETPMQPVTKSTTVLRQGSKGEAVRNLQSDLAAIGYVFQLGIDGRFGDETARHVRAFQRKHALTVDGIAGPVTLKAIAKEVAALTVDKSPEPPAWPQQTVEKGWFARLIEAIFGNRSK